MKQQNENVEEQSVARGNVTIYEKKHIVENLAGLKTQNRVDEISICRKKIK